MTGEAPVPYLRYGQPVFEADGKTLAPWFVNGWNALVDRVGGEQFDESYGVINGAVQAAQAAAAAAAAAAATADGKADDAQADATTANTAVGQVATGLAAEIPARVAGDAAGDGTGDGTGTTDSRPYSGVAVPDATWVNAVTLYVTTTAGSGTYTFNILPDQFLNGPLVTPDTLDTFNGNWRLVEYRVSDGDTTVLETGTWTATEEAITWEGGSADSTAIAFTGLPASEASNYNGAVELRLDLQRASGSEAVTGLSGNASVSWA